MKIFAFTCVRLSGLEPEITEPKSVVFPITPQPVKTYTYFHKRVYAHFTTMSNFKNVKSMTNLLSYLYHTTRMRFVLIFKDSSGVFYKYIYSHEPMYS